MKKLFLSLLSILFCVNSFYAKDVKSLSIGVLNGPSCVPIAYMMENKSELNGTKISYEVFSDPQALLPKLIKKEVNIGFLPVNIASKVYNSSNKLITCIAVSGNGNLCLISSNKKLKTLSELKGKTVYVAGQGAAPEYIFTNLLEKNNIQINTKDGVTLDFSIPTAQLAPSLISGKIEYAVVPEPFATIAVNQSKNVYASINLQTEFKKIYGKNAEYPLTVLVCNTEFLKENSKIVEDFLLEYKNSYEWTIKNPKDAGILCEKNNLGLKSKIVELAIPKSNYVFILPKNDKIQIESLLNIYYKSYPGSIGNKLPDEDFYY